MFLILFEKRSIKIIFTDKIYNYLYYILCFCLIDFSSSCIDRNPDFIFNYNSKMQACVTHITVVVNKIILLIPGLEDF